MVIHNNLGLGRSLDLYVDEKLDHNCKNMGLYIISNRLPLKVSKEEGNFIFKRSEGGLATGLGSLDDFEEKHWIGWPGIFLDNEAEKETVTAGLLAQKLHPIYLTEDQIHDYYEGYSNSTLWPLCHYFYSYIQYEYKYWESYREVNRLFCEEAVKFFKPGDVVWVHDYQLMLLPAMLREKIEGLSIGFFLHIPFPAYELFRVLPERAEILRGLLGADLIGFHTHEYMRHFISAAYRVLGVDCELDEIDYNGRIVRVESFPMGINYDLHHDAILNPSIQKIAKQFREDFGGHKLVLSVDRLDYSKGILHRLKGFELFLENHPEFWGKVSLVMVVVPSRDHVEMYRDLKTSIDMMIGALNGRYSSLDWRPVYYFYRSFPFEELMALYHIAQIALVTPLRDGMNLVAKEYVAAKRDDPGVLILSEMAGAAIELKDALIINPNEVKEIEGALFDALMMPEEEQTYRMGKMQKTIKAKNVKKWVSDFIIELSAIKEKNEFLRNKEIGDKALLQIKELYQNSQNRLLLFDYDGTLVPIVKLPELAIPDSQLIKTLKSLTADPRNNVVISSGRDTAFLDKWFGEIDLQLVAEHGAFYKEHGTWNEIEYIRFPEEPEIINIMQQIMDKTPGSMLEFKKTSIVWHYRNSDRWLAELREKQLINALIMPCARLNLHIMRGHKLVEVKTAGTNKGTEVTRLMSKNHYDFVMAMGDDITDEDMFNALPEEAVTIKIGTKSDRARYSLNQYETISFLNSLIT